MELERHDEMMAWVMAASVIAGGIATRGNLAATNNQIVDAAAIQADRIIEELRKRLPPPDRRPRSA